MFGRFKATLATVLGYRIVGDEDGDENVTVFVEGEGMLGAHSTHPNYAAIVEGARAGKVDVNLFDVAKTVGAHFRKLTERVTTCAGRLYLDGDEIANTLTAQVLRFIDEGREDWRPLLNFFERVQANPNAHSRAMLYDWLAAEDFAITEDGLIIGYKGVAKDGEGNLVSVNRGRAMVNGIVHEGAIPNGLGDVVTMPRGEVTFDPANGCSRGLHVGTYTYARGWAQGALLEVLVDPRDVVSVPTDCGAQKMRTCRYKVVKLIDAPHTEAVVYGAEYGDDWGDVDPEGEGDWL